MYIIALQQVNNSQYIAMRTRWIHMITWVDVKAFIAWINFHAFQFSLNKIQVVF